MTFVLYQPDNYVDSQVTLTPYGFKFSKSASNKAGLHDIHWMRVHYNADDRIIVFEPMAGDDKKSDVLKLGTSKRGDKSLVTKGLISRENWIRAISKLDIKERRFELRQRHVNPKGWFIQLMPAFEESIKPSDINQLDDHKGIYRYVGGDDGTEIIYIGKGIIKDRFREEHRKDWSIAKIEYSIINDDQKAYEWEAYWINRYKEEHNGRRPRYNKVDGVQTS